MKKLLTFLLIILSFAAQSQILQEPTVFGSLYKNLGAKNVLLLPTGCGEPAPLSDKLAVYNQFAIYGDSCANILYLWNPALKLWKTVSGTDSLSFHTLTINGDSTQGIFSRPNGTKDTLEIQADGYIPSGVQTVTGSAVDNTDPYNPVINSTGGSSIDTTYLSNRINQKVDSVKLSTDSLFAKVNGTWVFQFKSPAFANWKTNGSKIYTDATGVGFGTSNPQSKIHIEGSTTPEATSSEDSTGIMLTNSAPATASNTSIVSMPIILASKFYNGITSADYLYKLQAEASVLRILVKVGSATNYTNIITVSSNGNFNTSGLISSSANGISSLNSALSLQRAFTIGNVGGNTLIFNSVDYLSNKSVWNNNSTGSTGSEFNSFAATNAINNTVGTTTVRGFYFNPTVQILTGTTLVGFQNKVGNNLFNTTSGSTSIGQTTTIPSNRIFQVAATTQVSHPNPNMTIAQRDAIGGVSAGDTIFCTDCTANDSSTGVTQTFNGTTWKNLW